MTPIAGASKVLARLRGESGAAAARQRPFVDRHFLAQEERPAGVREVGIDLLDPFLRNLLFTDGTVTRALEVQTLAPVLVTRLSQAEVSPVPAEVAGYLETGEDEVAIRRRVGIAAGSDAAAAILAESHILPDRLPPGFLGLLDGAPDGIGQSLQRIALESYRELLWFGLDAAPAWAADSGGETIRRLYRIVSSRQAAILISESFAVERHDGRYHLVGLDRGGEGQAPAGGRR
jgi:chorismate-pyruvate lyase